MRPGFALCLLLALAAPASAQTDPFAGNPRATLRVSIELSGSARENFPNGVEWAAIAAVRRLDLSYELVDVANDGLPIVGGVPAGAVPPAMQDLEKKLAECGESQVCLAGVMMAFAQSGQGGENPFAAMTGMQPGRYRNFAGDRTGTCAEGTVTVQDVLQGVTIPPPNPAVAYRFSRDGALDLPQTNSAVTDTLCAVEVSVDTATNEVSLRLSLQGLPVPVTLGPGAFTDESSTAFAEGEGPLELLSQATTGGKVLTGSTGIEYGSASHNSGQVSAALSGKLSWSLDYE